MKKACRLVLLKRYPADRSLRKEYEPEYWAGPGVHPQWVHFQSNAALFNKSDLKRDVVDKMSELVKADQSMQIWYTDVWHDTVYEMVELIEKKSIGWVILRRCSVHESAQRDAKFTIRIASIPTGNLNEDHYAYQDQLGRVIFDTEMKNFYLERLVDLDGSPEDRSIFAKELFWEGE